MAPRLMSPAESSPLLPPLAGGDVTVELATLPRLMSSGTVSVTSGIDERSRANEIRLLSTACVLTTLFFFIELVGGYYAGSLAVMSDAAHLMSDLAGFLISLLALSISCLPANAAMSFGFARAEVLGAFVSVLFIWALTIVLVVAALRRLVVPTPVNGPMMIILGCIGLGVNLLLGLVLGHSHAEGSHGHGHTHGHSHDHSNHGLAHSHSHHSHSHEPGGHGRNRGPTAHDGAVDHVAVGHHAHSRPSNTYSSVLENGETGIDAVLATRLGDPIYSRESIPTSGDGESPSAAALRPSRAKSHKDHHAHGHGHAPIGDYGAARNTTNDEHEHVHVHSDFEHNMAAGTQQHHIPVGDVTHARSWWDRLTGGNDIDSMNLRAAYLHVLGDALQNIGVILAAVVITIRPSWVIVDPMCTLLFAIIVVMTTKDLARDAFFVLMEGTPPALSLNVVYKALLDIPDVIRIGDLHIWSLTGRRSALSAHVFTVGGQTAHDVLKAAQRLLADRFGIDHVTIQVNCDEIECCDDSHVGRASRNCVSASVLGDTR